MLIMQRLLSILFPLMTLLATPAFAVSFGDELILSRLGDPVEVEIEVLQWEDMDLERVQIMAATPEEYEVFDLTWLPVLDALSFNLVGPTLDGHVRVLVSSRDPVNEPFLELLLVMRWPGGSLRREYVLLFDPPQTPVPGISVIRAEPEPLPVQAVAEPESPPALVPEAPTPEPETAASAVLPAEQASAPEPAAPVSPSTQDNEPEEIVAAVTEQPEAAEIAVPEPEPAVLPVQEPVIATIVQPAEPPAPAAQEPPAPEPVQTAVATTQQVVTVLPEPAVAEPPPQPVQVPEPAPVPAQAPPAASPAPEQPDVRTQIALEVETLAPAPAASTVAQPVNDERRRSYQVRSGDSLWNIARQFRPAGAGENLYQMLLSIHDLNRTAFINGNISLLKANALMQIPDADDIARIDPLTAEAEFERRWDAGTQRFDTVARGEAQPLFGDDEQEPVASADVPEEELPPGLEAPPATEDDSALILVSSSNVLPPVQVEPDAGVDAQMLLAEDAAQVPTSVDTTTAQAGSEEQTEEQTTAEQSTAGQTTVAEAQVAEAVEEQLTVARQDLSALPPESVRKIIETRAQITAELEQQVVEMRARRQAAEEVAEVLNASLQSALAKRTARESEFGKDSLVLGGATLAVLLALILAVVFTLRLAGEMRTRQGLAGNALQAQQWRAFPQQAGPAPGENREMERKEPVFDVPRPDTEPAIPPSEQVTTSGVPAASEEPEELFARMEDLLAGEKRPDHKEV
jgi:FimV-like protein